MTRSKTLLIPVLASVAAGAGFFAGRSVPPQPHQSEAPRTNSAAANAIQAAAARQKSNSFESKTHGAKVPAEGISSSPGSAAELLARLEKLAASQSHCDAELIGVFPQWLASHPDDALAFVSASPQRDALLRIATRRWAETDPVAASAWLAEHNDFGGRDAMAAGIASAIANGDPAAAVAWAASIRDAALKFSAAEDSGYAFYLAGDETARDAFRRMGLPETAIPALLNGAMAKKLDALARRGAQNLASTYGAARAAGAVIEAESVDGIMQALSAGVSGSGQFSGTLFQVDTSVWPERERAESMTRLELVGEALIYKSGSSDE